MAERIVIDTGPLVALARADALDLIGKLTIAFICPPEVVRELDEGVSPGYPIIQPKWLSVVSLSRPIHPVAQATLDMGEAAVVQLAVEQGMLRVCIDERKGRQVALAVGLPVTGTLGLLGRAKSAGLVSEVRPFVERMQRAGQWFDEVLVQSVLSGLGE